ncbi:MAG: J domain-containing protein [Leptolyngbyaceae cyanobacterium MO_188.B28]|nr:J domain-containing protein [Leptolyngbyaceae cyanobacterium MO_188.B28]
MSLADYYRVLGLRTGASFSDIKASYRRLARRWHPDINPSDQNAKDKFIRITEAYRELLRIVPPDEADLTPPISEPETSEVSSSAGAPVQRNVQPEPRKPPQVQVNPDLSQQDQQLKQQFYEQLQELFKTQKFPRAIALVEGLAQRMPKDSEVRQWQAITYQRWGRHLIRQNQVEKAKIYLKKALRTDPRNKSLQLEVKHDFESLEKKA